jgi:arylsulfatase A-like enzyme
VTAHVDASRPLAIACLAVVAWSSISCAPSPSEVRRLADAVAAAMGRETHTETIAGVTRAALPGTYAEVLRLPTKPGTVEITEASPDGVEVSFRCPARLAGRPAVLAVGPPLAKTPGADLVTERVRCPPAADTRVRLRLPARGDLDQAIWIIRGLEVDRPESGTITLPRGARLEVALGLSPALPDHPVAPARFRVVARDARGRAATVLERRLDPRRNAADAGWVRVEADLDPVRDAVGAEVRLGFEADAEGSDPVPTFPVWGDPTLEWPSAGTRERAPRWNLVLVSLDTLRPDRLGAYGAHRPTSPTLDALAAEATLFETVIAPAPWTLPSHVSMMTGLHSCAHGIVGPGFGNRLPAGIIPLAERLRDAGYATAAFTEDGFVDAAAVGRGFGYYWENRGGYDRVPTTVAHAEAWLRDEATEPFFLFFHTYQPHDPYFSPPEFEQLVTAGDGLAGARTASAAPREQQLVKYDAAIRYTDTAIARLLDALRAGRRGRRTLLVVTSDHGEAFGEHGATGHGEDLHEEVLLVPLLIWAPGLVAAGRRVPGPVGVIDVMPTILELVGLPVPPGISGVSLAAQARAGSTAPAVPERTLYSENSVHGGYRLAVRSPRWKAMWDAPGLQIFDLERDPGERAPVATAELVGQAIAARARFEEECTRQRTDLASAVFRQAPPSALPDPERERQLKALGYVE